MRTPTENKRSRSRFIGLVIMGLPLLLALNACSVSPVVVGHEYQLTRKKSGNLADEEAKTPQQRAKVLAEVLTERRKDLSDQNIDKDSLAFTPYGESTIILPNGQTHVLVVLYQTYKGARVMEGVQYGSFDLNTGELRTVRAHLQGTEDLPDPPAPDLKTWSGLHTVFRDYLKQKGLSGVSFSISDKPVISSRLKVSGYLVQYANRNANTSLSRFAAIIDPKKERVHVLYDINTD